MKKIKNKEKSLKIGMYIRVSTEEQAENIEGSIRNQEQRLRDQVAYKNEQGIFGEICGVFIDRAKSGKDTNRPELQKMLRLIESGEINLVMVTELSRISRSIKDFAEIWAMMKNIGCGFMSLRESFDSTTAAGEMLIFSMANLSQFERRQTAERISLNFAARAKRGLYNGGSVPFGYELIEGKTGYLKVNKKHAEIVRTCFKYFLNHEGLTQAARALNNDGYRCERSKRGGGKPRLDYFTTGNLHHILRNKSYKGVRVYEERGEIFETKTVWDAIIDARTFDRVGKILEKNHRRKKPHKENRYPYLLSGMIFCKKCDAALTGKSAHGRNGKVPYYEHGWATRRGMVLSQHLFDCGNPRRFSGKKLEELVCSKMLEILSDKHFSEKLFERARKVHAGNGSQKEVKRLEAQLTGFNAQLEGLAERLSELPKTVSAAPFYKQMEKIEEKKKEADHLLLKTRADADSINKTPAALEDYWQFVKQLKYVFEYGDAQIREKIIKRLVQKIEVNPDEVTMHMIVDESVVPREPKKGSRIFLCAKFKAGLKSGSENEIEQKIKKAPSFLMEALNHFFNFGSNTLTIGGGAGS